MFSTIIYSTSGLLIEHENVNEIVTLVLKNGNMVMDIFYSNVTLKLCIKRSVFSAGVTGRRYNNN